MKYLFLLLLITACSNSNENSMKPANEESILAVKEINTSLNAIQSYGKSQSQMDSEITEERNSEKIKLEKIQNKMKLTSFCATEYKIIGNAESEQSSTGNSNNNLISRLLKKEGFSLLISGTDCPLLVDVDSETVTTDSEISVSLKMMMNISDQELVENLTISSVKLNGGGKFTNSTELNSLFGQMNLNGAIQSLKYGQVRMRLSSSAHLKNIQNSNIEGFYKDEIFFDFTNDELDIILEKKIIYSGSSNPTISHEINGYLTSEEKYNSILNGLATN